MTDNHSDKQDLQLQKPLSTNPNSEKSDRDTVKEKDQRTLTQTVSPNELQIAPKKPTTKAPEPQTKMVNIAIANVNYSVFCPVDEEYELRSAVHYINDFALAIKKDAPNLSQEDLLVLSCLNLYEKINDNKKAEVEREQQDNQAEALLNKVIKDAQSIL